MRPYGFGLQSTPAVMPELQFWSTDKHCILAWFLRSDFGVRALPAAYGNRDVITKQHVVESFSLFFFMPPTSVISTSAFGVGEALRRYVELTGWKSHWHPSPVNH
jgi:hypothetical protein